MSLYPAIGTGSISTQTGLASTIAELRRRISAMEANRTSIGVGSITGTQIGDGVITSANIAANSITAANIATGTLTATQIAAGTITSELIAAGAITAGLIAADAVTADAIAANSITSEMIQSAAIQTTHLAAGSITTGAIEAGAITADKIAAGAVTSDKITVTNLAAITSNLGNITAGLITGATFRTSGSGSRVVMDSAGLRGYGLDGVTKIFEIDAGSGVASFTGVANIDPLSVIPGGAIVAGSVGTTQIATGSITANKIAAGAITASALSIEYSGPNLIKDSGFEYGKYDDGVYSTEMSQWAVVDGDANATTDEAWEGERSAKLCRAVVSITAYNGSGVSATPAAKDAGHTAGSYSYTLTAVRDGVELTGAVATAVVSSESLADILPGTVTITSDTDTGGTNHGGDRSYAITAIGSGGGETTLFEDATVDTSGVRKNILPPQSFSASPGPRGSGTLPGGEYGFAAITIGAGGETTPSFTAPTVPTTRLARPAAPTKTSNTSTTNGLYPASWRFWMVAVDANGLTTPLSGCTDASNPLDVVVTSTDALTLHWSPSENTYAAGYMVFYQDLASTDLFSFGPLTTTVTSLTFDQSDTTAATDNHSAVQFAGVFGTVSDLPSVNTSVEAAYSIHFDWTPQTGATNQRLYSYSQTPGDPNPDGSAYRQIRLMGTTGSYTYSSVAGWTGGIEPPSVNTTDLGGTTYSFSWPRQDGAAKYRVYLVSAENEAGQVGKYFEVPQPVTGSMVNFTDYGTQTHTTGTYPGSNTSQVARSIEVSWGAMLPEYAIDSYRIYRGTEGRIGEVFSGNLPVFVDRATVTPNAAQQPPTSSVGFPGGDGNVAISNAADVEYRVYPNADYHISAYIKGDAATVGSRIYVAADYYSESDSYLGSLVAEGVSTTSWQRIWAKGTTPAATHHVNVFIGADDIPGGAAIYADGIQLEKSQLLSEYSPRWDDYIPGSVGPTVLTPNSITSAQIMANSIQADRLFVSSLSAISADLGTITAGTINGTTITGATIRTAGSGQRIVLDASSMRFYDSFGAQQLTAFGSGIYTGTNVSGQRLQLTSAGLGGYNSTGTQLFKLNTDGTLNMIKSGGAWSSIFMREGSPSGAVIGSMQFADYFSTQNTTTVRGFSSPLRYQGKAELLAAAGDWAGGSDNRYGTVSAFYDASNGTVIAGASAGPYSRILIDNLNRSGFVQLGSNSSVGTIGKLGMWTTAPVTFGSGIPANSYGDATYTIPGLGFPGTYNFVGYSTWVAGGSGVTDAMVGISGDSVVIRYFNPTGSTTAPITVACLVFATVV